MASTLKGVRDQRFQAFRRVSIIKANVYGRLDRRWDNVCRVVSSIDGHNLQAAGVKVFCPLIQRRRR